MCFLEVCKRDCCRRKLACEVSQRDSHRLRLGLHKKTCLLHEKFATRSQVCQYVRNKSSGSNHVEASVFTPEVVSWKTFRRLTKEKATLTRENDKGKTVGTSHSSKKMYQFRFLGERKTEECSMCVGDYIDSDRDQFTVKGVSIPCIDTASYGSLPIQSVTVDLVRRDFYCLLPPALVYFATLQPVLFAVYCLIHCTTTTTPFSKQPQALCWSAIVLSVTRAVISLLPNTL